MVSALLRFALRGGAMPEEPERQNENEEDIVGRADEHDDDEEFEEIDEEVDDEEDLES
jgi:hypothetical protein